jgi:hypothetical protein
MVRRFLLVSAFFAAMAVCPLAASAQQQPALRDQGSAPAHISFVEGAVTLERDGRTDQSPGSMPLLAGDRVRTRAGRAEILFADGSTLHLDRDTTVDLQSDELVRLIDGRVRLSIPGPAREVLYRIDAPHATLQITEPGEYRAVLLRTSAQEELEAAVIRGRAELINEDGRTALRAGERAFARANAAPSYAYVFNSAAWDAFDRWSEERRSERLGLSTQYLPEEVRPYAGTLDRYGAWRYEPSHGYVWYPRVDVGWRPYYQGRWTTLPAYGWTWVGNDPWAWPTHHYGRWGISAGVWFWIPGRTWAPAWVSWGYAPGYVSWCPLGWNNRPVLQIVNVNLYRGYDPWRAWTVVPQRHFGVDYVHRRVVAPSYIDSRTRSAFAYRDSAPSIVGYAVPRAAAPIRVAGTGVSRRNSAPLLTDRSPDGQRRYAPSAAATPGGNQVERSSAGARSRMTPDRPVVRSRDAERPSTVDPQPRTQPRADDTRPTDQYRSRDGYRAGATYEAPDRRAAPPAGYERPGVVSQPPADDGRRSIQRVPQGGYDRRAPERPPQGGYDERPPDRAPQGSYERRATGPAPGPDRSLGTPQPAPAPSAQPGRAERGERAERPDRSSPPAAAAPPAGSRPRGGAPSGTAVRRPGGGG